MPTPPTTGPYGTASIQRLEQKTRDAGAKRTADVKRTTAPIRKTTKRR